MNSEKKIVFDLHPSEVKLIEIIRSMASGEIGSIKVHNGHPAICQIKMEGEELESIDIRKQTNKEGKI